MSVGPGVKPVTPALPLVPNKLKLFAVTMLCVFYFRRNGRLVASDQAIVEREGSGGIRSVELIADSMQLDYTTALIGDIA